MIWPFNRKRKHAWTDWLVVDRGVNISCGVPIGWYVVQERYCIVCGKTDVDDKAHYAGHYASMCTRRSEMGARKPRPDKVPA